MSKICEKCGNVIPDGTDVCPNCGRENYNDEVLQGMLSELGIDLEDDTAPAEQDWEETDSAATADKEPADEAVASDITMIFDAAKVTETAGKQSEKQAEKAEKAKKAEKLEQEPRKQAQTRKRRPEDEPAGKKKGANMKKNSAAIIGVLIGLMVALLLIAGGVAIMLYQMGFFTTMTDEELLGVSKKPAVTQQVSETPAPEVSEEPVASAEEAGASAVEEAPESAVEEPAEPSEEPIELDKFKVTGASTIYFYSRGSTEKVSYVIEPASAAEKIEWSSDDETVATVDANGVIQARRGGVCTITGSCGDTFIAVTVACDFEVPDTVLDMNMEDITMTYEGQSAELRIDYDLTDEQIEATVWESSDESVAIVDSQGVVTAVSNGTAVISASIADYTASCIVRCINVTGNKGYNNSESEYVINYEDVTLTRKGEYFKLTLESILKNEVPEFTWKSDDPDVATVDSKGVVTAVSDGTAYITTHIGQDQFRCIVRVRISD